MVAKILLEKIGIIAKSTNGMSFVYDISKDNIQCVQYRDDQNTDIEITNYCVNLLNGTCGYSSDRREIENLCNQIAEGNKEITATFRTNIPDGSFHWVSWYGKTIYDKNDVPESIIGWMLPTSNSKDLMYYMLEHMNDLNKEATFNEIFLEKVADNLSLDAVFFIGYGPNSQKEFQYHWNTSTCNFLNCMDVNFSHLEELFDDNNYLDLTHSLRVQLGLISTKIKSAGVIKRKISKGGISSYLLIISCKNNRVWNTLEIDTLQIIISSLSFAEERNHAISENIGLKDKISKDLVTGLSKIEAFKKEATKIIDNNPDRTYAIIHSGFYNFQYINDSFGYAIGDAILKRFGKFMTRNLSCGRAFSRGSGDQFVFMIEYDDIRKAQERFITYCKRFCNEIEQEIGINALIITSGICYIKKEGSQKVAKAIDNAHMTRKSIRNKAETNCQIFRDETRANIAERMKIAANMKKALENEEFVVYFQPKINLQSGEVVGAEALVRWQLKNGIMIYPNQFIPLFEENGFVSQLDYYVLQKVLMYLLKRKQNGKKMIPISVNFSRRHQDNPNFVSDIVALLDEYKIERKWIEIEITESAFMNDIQKLHNNLVQLRDNQICISIDDFGSGYSSLNVLSSVPADIIKIDRVFLLGSDKKSRNMLKYLVLMIKGMGYRTITEGVETKEQMLFLREIGCEMVQGYYYAKPMPIIAFDKYCIEHGMCK